MWVRIRSHLWCQCETWCDFWLQLENGYANHKSLPKCLLSSPQHQENPKIPEPGSHVHDYTCIYYKPDWLLQQFDEWTTRESHQETSVCAKHSCQTSFQSAERWSLNSRPCYASLASSQILNWIQNTVHRLQRTSWQGPYLRPRNDHPIKKQKIFHKIQWRMWPEGSKIQAWYFWQACIRSVWASGMELLAKGNKKKTIEIINEKSKGPINLTNHWRKRLWISLHVDLKRLN